MTSRSFSIVTNSLDPREVVTRIVSDMCAKEKNYPLTEAGKKKFSPRYESRSWGEFRWDADDITDFSAYDGSGSPYFEVEYGRQVPCGRGCCSDYFGATFKVPDKLVALYEAVQDADRALWDDDFEFTYEGNPQEDYDAAVEARVKLNHLEIEEEVKKEAAAERAKKKAEDARKAREKEERDRKEFERLRTKFGDAA